jgi:nucleosome binding factor SPN SPT16 subunit
VSDISEPKPANKNSLNYEVDGSAERSTIVLHQNRERVSSLIRSDTRADLLCAVLLIFLHSIDVNLHVLNATAVRSRSSYLHG